MRLGANLRAWRFYRTLWTREPARLVVVAQLVVRAPALVAGVRRRLERAHRGVRLHADALLGVGAGGLGATLLVLLQRLRRRQEGRKRRRRLEGRKWRRKSRQEGRSGGADRLAGRKWRRQREGGERRSRRRRKREGGGREREERRRGGGGRERKEKKREEEEEENTTQNTPRKTHHTKPTTQTTPHKTHKTQKNQKCLTRPRIELGFPRFCGPPQRGVLTVQINQQDL